MLNEKWKNIKRFSSHFDPGEKLVLLFPKKKKQTQRKRFFNATFLARFSKNELYSLTLTSVRPSVCARCNSSSE
jgi:hypothetical protein